ncbi:MAG: hemerythrin domain-containing protein [Coriobacteriia bacterium]
MSGTADLRSEHVGVGRMLTIMDAMAKRAEAGALLDVDDLVQIIEFLRVFVDQCHHAKEEELLFPAMRAAKIASAEKTIVSLLADHEQGREAVARIESGARRLADRGDSASAELADVMTAYTRLLRAHIRREEVECFDVADRELPIDVQDGLTDGFERIELEVVGKGVHEGFHLLLDRLRRVYHA